ncbi:2'-5' RNA ligase family protein [Altererythrobacter sp. GH1-8]|uniref:2'-5' RNA ligase family protein n=1 Tax=Altererythrobacter sp. GH1-8 TaxID=3349333 RepID=UPI00374CAF23
MNSSEQPPLILTALLPQDLHNWATALRTAHFPPDRNYLEAHVTLFHALPAGCEPEVIECCKALAKEHAPVAARLVGLMSLGGGTALKLESPEMRSLRAEIADRFHGLLTQQDQHSPRLHVTIQNKVTSTQAKALQAELDEMIEPRAFAFRGIGLFRYRGGPWEPVREFAFRGNR